MLGYSNAKAAIDNFTRWMATEMAIKYGDGVRVNAVAPGFFISNQNRALLLNEDGILHERGQQVINKTPFRRFGEQEEIYGTIHYLLSMPLRLSLEQLLQWMVDFLVSAGFRYSVTLKI